MLIHHSSHLFSQVRSAATLKEIKDLLRVTANDYWHYHYRFDEPSSYRKKVLGEQMINNIIINTIIPVVFAYGQIHKEQVFKNKAMQWLDETTAEQNAITKKWELLEVANHSALDSQALTELTKQYCLQKRCLQCAVGNAILKRCQ
ncbi:MAG: DUF2851 family protein [Agriterribacter sp.]